MSDTFVNTNRRIVPYQNIFLISCVSCIDTMYMIRFFLFLSFESFICGRVFATFIYFFIMITLLGSSFAFVWNYIVQSVLRIIINNNKKKLPYNLLCQSSLWIWSKHLYFLFLINPLNWLKNSRLCKLWNVSML